MTTLCLKRVEREARFLVLVRARARARVCAPVSAACVRACVCVCVCVCVFSSFVFIGCCSCSSRPLSSFFRLSNQPASCSLPGGQTDPLTLLEHRQSKPIHDAVYALGKAHKRSALSQKPFPSHTRLLTWQALNASDVRGGCAEGVPFHLSVTLGKLHLIGFILTVISNF